MDDGWSDFSVDWISGIVRVKQDLDMGRKEFYELAVWATVRSCPVELTLREVPCPNDCCLSSGALGCVYTKSLGPQSLMH